MRYRGFGRTGWQVSEIGYGMWGMGGWTGSDDQESLLALDRAFALGCNFFDTAWVYGDGKSETLLAKRCARIAASRRHVATKIPPKNMKWPGKAEYPVQDTYPAAHIREYTEKSLRNLGIETIDLQQFHVWSDAWAGDDGWQRAVDDLKREKLVRAIGISVNRWEAANVLRALRDRADRQRPGGLQHLRPGPRGRAAALLPGARYRGDRAGAVRRGQPHRHADAGVALARGRLAEHLFQPRAPRRDAGAGRSADPLVPEGMDLPELALRFILEHPAVSTTIPGHAPPGPRRAEPGGQRRRPAAAPPGRRPQEPPLEPGTGTPTP